MEDFRMIFEVTPKRVKIRTVLREERRSHEDKMMNASDGALVQE